MLADESAQLQMQCGEAYHKGALGCIKVHIEHCKKNTMCAFNISSPIDRIISRLLLQGQKVSFSLMKLASSSLASALKASDGKIFTSTGGGGIAGCPPTKERIGTKNANESPLI